MSGLEIKTKTVHLGLQMYVKSLHLSPLAGIVKDKLSKMIKKLLNLQKETLTEANVGINIDS